MPRCTSTAMLRTVAIGAGQAPASVRQSRRHDCALRSEPWPVLATSPIRPKVLPVTRLLVSEKPPARESCSLSAIIVEEFAAVTSRSHDLGGAQLLTGGTLDTATKSTCSPSRRRYQTQSLRPGTRCA